MLNLLISPYRDPYMNLSLENYFLESMKPDEEFLFLYINNPSVVIGRFQNPWLECSPLGRKDTYLVRRQSGGGTVYHDEGNLNFSFIRHKENFSRTKNLEIICRILLDSGIELQISKRHDLTVVFQEKSYKVSGSAFRHKKDRAFHHGTLLVSCATQRLKDSITPGEKKVILQASGTKSNRSEVINLNQIKPGLTISGLIDSFESWCREGKDCNVNNMSDDEWEELSETQTVQKERDTLLSEDWILGKTPAFTQDISSIHHPESVNWQIRVNKGKIEETPEDLSFLTGLEYGRRHTGDNLRKKLKSRALFGLGEDELFSRLIQIIG